MAKIDYTGITNEQHQAINDVCDCFDYEKIVNHMKSVGWTWAKTIHSNGECEYYQPDEDDLRDALRSLVVSCFRSVNFEKEHRPEYDGPCWSSSGGFTVYAWPDNCCQAYFSVTDWWCDPEDFE